VEFTGIRTVSIQLILTEINTLKLNPPKGFKVDQGHDEIFSIEYERTGMWAMNSLLVGSLIVFFIACIFVTKAFIAEYQSSGFQPIALLLTAAVFAAEFIILAFTVYYLFAKKSFRFNEQSLVIETRIFTYMWTHKIQREKSTKIIQIKDGGGEDEDSFHSWGLNVLEDRTYGLITRQLDEKSYWLGRVISEWCGVQFDVNAD